MRKSWEPKSFSEFMKPHKSNDRLNTQFVNKHIKFAKREPRYEKEVLLSDLTWSNSIRSDIYITQDDIKQVGLEEDTFYEVPSNSYTGLPVYFASIKAYQLLINHEPRGSSLVPWRIQKNSLVNHLYKILNIQIFDE